jgi:N-acetyl-anhydromuramyl-L-alanine amidase AmpD
MGVVIHTIEGTADAAESWFHNPQAGGVGAHVIMGHQGAVQTTDLDAVCWHAPGANRTHVGIEHEGFSSYGKLEWLKKDARHMLRASANRTAWICWHYKLGKPTRYGNVFGHVDFPAGGHNDPGSGWPWTFYIYLARRAYKHLVASRGKRWS